jgi:site-specific DNA-methyltransferase (adenine-specific)
LIYQLKDFNWAWNGLADGVRGRNKTEKIAFIQLKSPVALYKWLLSNYAKQGDKILDTHLGSGSSRIAAYEMGFDFTAFELDTEYYEAQDKRYNAHIAQLKLELI